MCAIVSLHALDKGALTCPSLKTVEVRNPLEGRTHCMTMRWGKSSEHEYRQVKNLKTKFKRTKAPPERIVSYIVMKCGIK